MIWAALLWLMCSPVARNCQHDNGHVIIFLTS